MSFSNVLAELPALTVSERNLLIRRALELDNPELSAEDEVVAMKRLADYRRDPGSAIPLDEMNARLRMRLAR